MSRRLLPFALTLVTLASVSQYAGAQQGVESYDQSVRIESLLQTDQTNIGQAIEYPATERPEVSIFRVMIPPGTETGWHKHPVHTFAVVLRGELNIKRRDGDSHTYRAGDAFAEMVDAVHRGKSIGEEPVELIMFVVGEKDAPITVPADP